MRKAITERELMPMPLEPVDPADVWRCVQLFKDVDTDKLMTIKWAFSMCHVSVYNMEIIRMAIDEIVNSRLTQKKIEIF